MQFTILWVDSRVLIIVTYSKFLNSDPAKLYLQA